MAFQLFRVVVSDLAKPKFGCARVSSFSTLQPRASDEDALPSLPPFDYEPRPYNGRRADEIFQRRKKFLGPSLFHFYRKPINIVEGKMQYLFDEDGRRYLDAFAGIVTVSC